MLLNWLKQWAISNSRSKSRRSKNRLRLPSEIQMLERRVMLTNYVVTTAGDVVNDPMAITPDGEISLREAILAANLNMQVGDAPAGELSGASGVTDTITFDSSLMGQTILIQGSFAISDDLDISGFGSAADLTIDAQMNSGLFFISESTTVSISHVTLTGGRVGEGVGGAIYNQGGTLTLDDVILTGNSADSGGGLYNEHGTVTIANSTITNNTAAFVGGGIANEGSEGIEGSGTITITNSTISQNTADFGGGIYNTSLGTATITGGTISQNSAEVDGGGIYNNGFTDSSAQVSGGSITDNSVVAETGEIFNGDCSSVTVTGASITSNRASDDGGGIFNDDGLVTVQSSTISQNIAGFGQIEGGGDGGGIANDGTFNILDTAIANNSANDGDGGGVASFDGDVSVTGGSITGNTADDDGGGVFNSEGNLSLFGTSVTGNSADESGGGVFTDDDGSTTITNSTIAMNIATSGGGVSNEFFGTTSISHSTLFENTALQDGGGIRNQGTLSLANSTVSRNLANGNGGGIGNGPGFQFDEFSNNSTATIVNSTIVLNRADADDDSEGTGGGIWTALDDLTFTRLLNTIVAGNVQGTNTTDVPNQTPNDVADKDLEDNSTFNLIGDPNSAGGLVEGSSGNRVGDGMGNLLPIDQIIDPILADNGGPTMTHLPVFGGRAIDAGSNANAIDPGMDGELGTSDDVPLENDQRGPGFPRVVDFPSVPNADGGIDIGAVEFDEFPTEISFRSDSLSVVGTENNGALGRVLEFTLERTGSAQDEVTVLVNTLMTTNGMGRDAVAGNDFTPLNDFVVTFGVGETTQTVMVQLSPDNIVELDETFLVRLSDPRVGGVVDDRVTLGDDILATGTILNDDFATISISDVASLENGLFEFMVTLSNPVAEGITVQIDTVGFSAMEGVDFATLDGMVLTFSSDGPLTQIVNVTILDDTQIEPNETFQVVLSNPLVGGMSDPARFSISDGIGMGTIINNDAIRIAGAGTGQGLQSMPPQVIVQNAATGEILHSFLAYAAGFTGGVRVAAGDVNGDGAADVITAAGTGGGPHVKVFDGLSGQLIREFFAYNPGFTGGVFVAAGDVNGDGLADILTGAGAGGGPHVRVFDGQSLQLIQDFFAFNPSFAGGVSVAAADINGNLRSDLILGAGAGGGPHVRVFDGQSLRELGSFFAYGAGFQGGVSVAGGDVNGDGFGDVITGAGAGGGPHVRIFNGFSLPQMLSEFFAFNATMTSGIVVGTTDTNGDASAEILVGTGPGSPAQIRIFNQFGGMLGGGAIFNPHFRSGVNVGGSIAPRTIPDVIARPVLAIGNSDIPLLENQSLEDDLMLQLLDEGTFGQLLLDVLEA